MCFTAPVANTRTHSKSVALVVGRGMANGHVVTRWSESTYEVDTWGKKTMSIESALAAAKAVEVK
jgi:hypothetical protein